MTDPYAGPPQVTPVWTPPPPSYGYGYQYPPPRPTNGLAIAAMVVSIVALPGVCAYGLVAIVGGPVGAILGHVARRKIKQSGEQGAGMALTGIILGWVSFALGLLTLAGFVALIIWAESQPTY